MDEDDSEGNKPLTMEEFRTKAWEKIDVRNSIYLGQKIKQQF